MTLAHDTLRRWLVTSGDARLQAVLATSPLAYWRQKEGSGSSIVDSSSPRYDGTYTGVTWDGTQSPYNQPVPFYDGALDYGNVYSAGFVAVFDPQLFSINIFIKVASAFWTDGSAHAFFNLEASATNYIRLWKASNNQIRYNYVANGTTLTVNKALTTTTWFCMGMTVSLAGDRMIAYYNGVQEGATQTGLGTFAGPIISTRTVIGAQDTTPTFPHDGYLAEAIVHGSELSAGVMATLGTPP